MRRVGGETTYLSERGSRKVTHCKLGREPKLRTKHATDTTGSVEVKTMRIAMRLLLVTIVLVGSGMYAPHALAADDDGAEKYVGPLSLSPFTFFPRPRYLVTFIKSRTTDPIRTATAVSVTNNVNSGRTCGVSVEWFRGFESTPACTTTFSLEAGFQTDFCSRGIPDALTTCNSTCAPELTFHEGKAVVKSDCKQLGVSARVYYTTEATDSAVTAISDSGIVPLFAFDD
jgi:hypothetical protein